MQSKAEQSEAKKRHKAICMSYSMLFRDRYLLVDEWEDGNRPCLEVQYAKIIGESLYKKKKWFQLLFQRQGVEPGCTTQGRGNPEPPPPLRGVRRSERTHPPPPPPPNPPTLPRPQKEVWAAPRRHKRRAADWTKWVDETSRPLREIFRKIDGIRLPGAGGWLPAGWLNKRPRLLGERGSCELSKIWHKCRVKGGRKTKVNFIIKIRDAR